MSLERLEMLHLLAEDGLASPDELMELEAAGIDPGAWKDPRRALVDALRAPALGQGFADAVLGDIGLRDQAPSVREALLGALATPHHPELAGRVADHLGQGDASAELGRVLREALSPDEVPDLAEAVLSTLQLPAADAGAALRSAVAREAGPAPDLWAGIAAAIGAPVSAVEEMPQAEVVTLARRRRSWWAASGAVIALAAAALLAILSPLGSDEGTLDASMYRLAAVNEVEIEDIIASDEAIVQVLQFEEDAPTIIFFEVPDEPPAADGDEGTTL